MTEVSPVEKHCKNAKNTRLPAISIRLGSKEEKEKLDQLVRVSGKPSRNAFCIARIFGKAGDTTGDTQPLQDALDQVVLLMVKARVNSRDHDVKMPGEIIRASITRLKTKGVI